MKFKPFAIIFILICMVSSQSVLAGRIGGGKSRGMQRSQATYSQSNSAQANSSNYNNTQPRNGMGAGTAAVLGAAAGVAGGYMLGKGMANENNKPVASGVTNQQANENVANNNAIATTPKNEAPFPWGIIAILVVLLIIGLAFFKRKSRSEFNNHNGGVNNNSSEFNIPTIQRNTNHHNTQAMHKSNKEYLDKFKQVNGGNHEQNISAKNNKSQNDEAESFENSAYMPDGIEKVYFLRQAKGMFLHIQSMNNPDNLTEVEKYMTPELYSEVKEEISKNNHIADFSGLNCELLGAKIVDNTLVASVKFDGEVSEDPSQPMQKFSEIWNFLKPDISYNKWLVAGIQQSEIAMKKA